MVLRGVCVLVCVRRYHVGPEGCVSLWVMRGVSVPASGLRGGCDHVGFLVLCVCVCVCVCVCHFSGECALASGGCVWLC